MSELEHYYSWNFSRQSGAGSRFSCPARPADDHQRQAQEGMAISALRADRETSTRINLDHLVGTVQAALGANIEQSILLNNYRLRPGGLIVTGKGTGFIVR